MKRILLSSPWLFVVALALMGCGCKNVSATDLGRLTEAGMVIAGEDPDRARRAGSAASRLAATTAEMPVETEVTLGEGIALRSSAKMGGIHPDNDLQRYVNLVGLNLARFSDRPSLPWVFVVADNDEPNAWACPGGTIFISSGAIRSMEDEAQLAGVLAHEIAHVTQRHMVRVIRRAEFFTGLGDLGAATVNENIAQYSSAVDLGLETLFEKGFDRSMEFEADSLGIELAARAGYDPKGLRRYLTAMASAQGRRLGGGWLLSTHPPARDRTAEMDRVLSTTGLDSVEGARAAERFRQRTASLRTP